MTPVRQGNSRKTWVWRLHLWSGLGAAAILLLIAITGLLLNHTATLQLAQRGVTQQWLLRWYSLVEPGSQAVVALEHNLLVQLGDSFYMDGTLLPGRVAPLLGALQLADGRVVVADAQGLSLYSPAAELIDNLPYPGSGGAQALHYAPDTQTIYFSQQSGVQATGVELLGWRPQALPEQTLWPRLQPPTQAQLDTYLPRYYEGAVSYERLLQDLHTGRLFGPFGVVLFDLAAVVVLLQIGTGIVLALRQPNPRA